LHEQKLSMAVETTVHYSASLAEKAFVPAAVPRISGIFALKGASKPSQVSQPIADMTLIAESGNC
jgi:hypothetical protein